MRNPEEGGPSDFQKPPDVFNPRIVKHFGISGDLGMAGRSGEEPRGGGRAPRIYKNPRIKKIQGFSNTPGVPGFRGWWPGSVVFKKDPELKKSPDSRGPLGAFLGPLKAFLGPLGAFWGCLGAFWDPHERQGDDAGRVAGGAPDSTPRSEGVAPWREVTQHPFKLF